MFVGFQGYLYALQFPYMCNVLLLVFVFVWLCLLLDLLVLVAIIYNFFLLVNIEFDNETAIRKCVKFKLTSKSVEESIGKLSMNGICKNTERDFLFFNCSCVLNRVLGEFKKVNVRYMAT
jgi:hypothetical protein